MPTALSRVCWVPILAAALTASWGSEASANPFDLYGPSSRGAASGNTGTASATDYSATYYNPAALVLGESSAGVGFIGSGGSARILPFARPSGYGIPDLTDAGPAIADEDTLRQRRGQRVPSQYGVLVGAANRLGTENLRLGVMAYVPLVGTEEQMSTFNDERERLFSNQLQFELLGGRVQHATVFLAAAYQVTDWLAIGFGASYMPAADTQNFIYLDNIADQSDVDLNVGLALRSRFRPNAGVVVLPAEGWRVGVSFRDVQFLRLTGRNEVQVRGLQGESENYPFYQDLDLTLQFSPRTFTAGASWTPGPVTISTDLRYYVWSSYRNNQGKDAGFNDTFSPRVGMLWQVDERHGVRAGLEWEPSPVGDTSGRFNYVDNDRFVTAVGSEHALLFDESRLVFSWHVQAHWLLTSTVNKRVPDTIVPCGPGVTEICDEVPNTSIDPDTGEPYVLGQGLQTSNPGFPGWTSGGVVASAGAEITWEF